MCMYVRRIQIKFLVHHQLWPQEASQLCTYGSECTWWGLQESFVFAVANLCRMSQLCSICVGRLAHRCSHLHMFPCGCMGVSRSSDLLQFSAPLYISDQAFPILPWHSPWYKEYTLHTSNPSFLWADQSCSGWRSWWNLYRSVLYMEALAACCNGRTKLKGSYPCTMSTITVNEKEKAAWWKRSTYTCFTSASFFLVPAFFLCSNNRWMCQSNVRRYFEDNTQVRACNARFQIFWI